MYSLDYDLPNSVSYVFKTNICLKLSTLNLSRFQWTVTTKNWEERDIKHHWQNITS